MGQSTDFEKFVYSTNDDLAAEHAIVAAWIEEAVASVDPGRYLTAITTTYDPDHLETSLIDSNRSDPEVDLKSLPSGKIMLAAKGEQSVRHVRAAIVQECHWEEQVRQLRERIQGSSQQAVHQHPSWREVTGRRRKAHTAINTLLRRTLPLKRDDLLALMDWCSVLSKRSSYIGPVVSITRALQRYGSDSAIDSELSREMMRFTAMLRFYGGKDGKRLATKVEQVRSASSRSAVNGDEQICESKSAPMPAPAGHPGILKQLKQFLEVSRSDVTTATTVIEPDRFEMQADSPLREEHVQLGEFLREVLGTNISYCPDLAEFGTGRVLLALQPAALGRLTLAAAERHISTLLDRSDGRAWQSGYMIASLTMQLAKGEFILPRQELFDWLLYLSANGRTRDGVRAAKWIEQIEKEVAATPISEGERYILALFRSSLIAGPPLGVQSDEIAKLSKWIGDGASYYLVPGEVWTDAANADIGTRPREERPKWSSLLAHALSATAARPSAKWLKTAEKLTSDLGSENVHRALSAWLPLVTQGPSIRKVGLYPGDVRGMADVPYEENATCLRGLIWLVQLSPRKEDLTRAITSVALSAYKKVPGVGARAVKVGNAAVYALSEMGSTEAVGQLAMLKVRVKFGTAQKEIEKAFNVAAEALSLPRDQIEEMGVPSYGLEEVGRRCETFGDYRAEMIVNGSDAELKWFDAKDKPLKSVPAKVKSEHKEDLKELQESLKDIQSMLAAQRDRIDSLFLAEKTWPIDNWRERYLNHPLIGTITQRLLWCIDGAGVIFVEGKPTDSQGRVLEHGKTAEVSLWHPVGRRIEEIAAWRRRLEELQITQPFKQAHREVYLLTDAERNTNTYSNRFAAHVLRQHQFNALCAARGWKNKLRLMVDDVYPPACKELPQCGLRAEFWVEGIGQEYGSDTNDSGVYLRLATDQVRFYRTEAATNLAHAGGGGYTSRAHGQGETGTHEPLPLEQVPALVFSEIMRDVDLFVGVASVGNDPTWQDGGPEGRYRDYWQSYSFGELSGTATTRKQVLERLIPRLKIADRCSLSDRFLVVRGEKRTYKIHLGSGNILMEPNDQYLCIVPDAKNRVQQDDLFLPFEGDNTLSIIISKALLLAADTKIKDPTITRQIEGR